MGLLFEDVVERDNYYIIRGFPVKNFASRIRRKYKSTKPTKIITATGLMFNKNNVAKVHKFFVPELLYLMKEFNYPQTLINKVVNNTWVRSITDDIKNNRIDLSRIKKEMNVTLKSHQSEYVEQYDVLKKKYLLNGYILSFDQGLGKTITSLAVATALNKKKVIIIAPKSTLESVWVHHIDKFYKEKKSVYVVNSGDTLDISYDFFVFNYESMDKIEPLIDRLSESSDDIMMIVDESHNFLRTTSNRTQYLIQLREDLDCTDMLLMSGTPVKAVGLELIPMMTALDPFFDKDALRIFKLAFGVNTQIATDVLRERLNVMMHRKVKEEVDVKLPPKTELTVKVKLPNGDDYTADKVKKGARLFAEQRFEYHNQQMDQYVNDFYEVMEQIKKHPKMVANDDLTIYLNYVQEFRRRPVDLRDPDVTKQVKWANTFEKKELIPIMTKEQKKKFVASKSAVKYLHLKIRGEVIGKFLMGMRMKMTSEMVENVDLKGMIDSALKKTVIFTSYVDTVNLAGEHVKDLGYNPMAIHGTTDGNVKKMIDMFQTNDMYNPLIASIQKLVTGVTLTAANSMIWLNKPWRHIDYVQGSDRIHRIGQDTECFIYTILLDTGEKHNLSTRMEEIAEATKKFFTEIVGDNIKVNS